MNTEGGGEQPYVLVAVTVVLSCLMYQAALHGWRIISEKLLKSYNTLSRIDKRDWSGRSPSTLHALVLSFACIYLFILSDTFCEDEAHDPPYPLRTSSISTAMLAGSLGYFIMDLLMIVIYYPSVRPAFLRFSLINACAQGGCNTTQIRSCQFACSLVTWQ
jgi:hypothetical protein